MSSTVHLLCTLFLFLFPGGSVGKESAIVTGDQVPIPGSGKVSWRREMTAPSSILPEEFNGLRSLVDF